MCIRDRLEEELTRLRTEEKRLDAVKVQHDALSQQQITATDARESIAKKITPLEEQATKLTGLQEKLPELKAAVERVDQLWVEIVALDKLAVSWNETNKQRLELRSQYQEAKTAVDVFVTERANTQKEADRVDADLAKVEAKLVELSAVGTAHSCPTCKQEIKDQALIKTGKVYEADRQKGSAMVQELAQKLADLDLKIEQGNAPLTKLVEQADQLPTIEYDQGTHDGLKKSLKDLEGSETK